MYCAAGCSGFFKRSIHRNRVYTCKAQGELKGRCPIDKTHRNQCRACRLNKCFQSAMNKDGEFVSKLILYYARFHPLYINYIHKYFHLAVFKFFQCKMFVYTVLLWYNVYIIYTVILVIHILSYKCTHFRPFLFHSPNKVYSVKVILSVVSFLECTNILYAYINNRWKHRRSYFNGVRTKLLILCVLTVLRCHIVPDHKISGTVSCLHCI